MKRILIVDDDADMRRIFILVFRAAKWNNLEIVQSDNWRGAVELIDNSEPFDLVITDLRMPDAYSREGFLVVNAARLKSAHTKIILLSGDFTPADRRDARADQLIDKPPQLRFFIATIRELIPDIDSSTV